MNETVYEGLADRLMYIIKYQFHGVLCLWDYRLIWYCNVLSNAKNHAEFKGIARRTEFLNFMLFLVIFYIFVVIIDKMIGSNYTNLKDLSFSNYISRAKLFNEVGLLTLISN